MPMLDKAHIRTMRVNAKRHGTDSRRAYIASKKQRAQVMVRRLTHKH